eukprot:gene33019-42717_t
MSIVVDLSNDDSVSAGGASDGDVIGLQTAVEEMHDKFKRGTSSSRWKPRSLSRRGNKLEEAFADAKNDQKLNVRTPPFAWTAPFARGSHQYHNSGIWRKHQYLPANQRAISRCEPLYKAASISSLGSDSQSTPA